MTNKARRVGVLNTPGTTAYFVDCVDGIRGKKARRVNWVSATERLCRLIIFLWCFVEFAVLVLGDGFKRYFNVIMGM
jgi:hypothetical protein